MVKLQMYTFGVVDSEAEVAEIAQSHTELRRGNARGESGGHRGRGSGVAADFCRRKDGVFYRDGVELGDEDGDWFDVV
jgi:hypothetical protein